MITRDLKSHEVHLMDEGGRLFLEEAKFPSPFSPKAFGSYWRMMLAADLGEVIVTMDEGRIIGAIGFSVTDCPFTGDQVALEQFWWVHANYRKSQVGLDLWLKFEERAKARKAKRIAMVHLASLNLQHVFVKRGYKLAEQTFWKEI